MKEVVEALQSAARVTTICHENPDGDTLGAAIAIAIAAERLGKQAEVVSERATRRVQRGMRRLGG